ncbi:cytochrome c oxidase-assembly factor cox-23 [Tuber brumale]|nr:cytochrome c oxidase-assembly factor cox-23 [Tuber brumale]
MPATSPAPPTPSSNGRDMEDPLHPETKAKFKAKASSQYFDPCQEAANRSIRCLNRNAGDRTMCFDYFQAYRDCKKKWVDDMKEEKRRKTRMSLF